LAKLTSIAQEAYSGIRVIKSYNQIEPMTKGFAAESDIFKEKSLELARVDAMFSPIMISMVGITTIITIYAGGLQVAKGTLTAGNIAEFVIYISMLTWPVTSIGWIASLIQQAAASQKRINEFLRTVPEIQNPTQNPISIEGDIQFQNVGFTYPDTGIVALENVTFQLNAGQKMAIIGRTGSGKTTIADLVVRMYDCTTGQIKIDNTNITIMDLANLRQRVGYVSQDIFLFSDTVSRNVAFGKSDAQQADIEEFTKYAAVYDEVLNLSEGFETMVGERGVTLSGGQKQRLSIARALIKKPDIVILDDCLSAVDTNTEAQIVNYLNTELANKTAIIITHRIYGLLQFDKIIVLDEGRIVEEGTHRELLDKKGYYADLFEMQNQMQTS
jgi:ATP-binding cassette subfamily B protein